MVIIMKLDAKTIIDMHWHSDYTTAAAFFGVSLSTLYRWIKRNQIPAKYLVLIKERRNHSLRGHGQLWEGWKIDEYGLITPDGHHINHDHLQALCAWLSTRRIINDDAAMFMAKRLTRNK